MRPPEKLLGIPYDKKAGPLVLPKDGPITAEEADIFVSQGTSKTNCQRARQMYELVTFHHAVPQELALSLETYSNQRNGLVVVDNFDGKLPTDKFFAKLKPGDVILAERMRTKSGKLRHIDRSDPVEWAKDLHVGTFVSEKEIYHACQNEGETTLWQPDQFAGFYRPVRGMRFYHGSAAPGKET